MMSKRREKFQRETISQLGSKQIEKCHKKVCKYQKEKCIMVHDITKDKALKKKLYFLIE